MNIYSQAACIKVVTHDVCPTRCHSRSHPPVVYCSSFTVNQLIYVVGEENSLTRWRHSTISSAGCPTGSSAGSRCNASVLNIDKPTARIVRAPRSSISPVLSFLSGLTKTAGCIQQTRRWSPDNTTAICQASYSWATNGKDRQKEREIKEPQASVHAQPTAPHGMTLTPHATACHAQSLRCRLLPASKQLEIAVTTRCH